MKLFAANVESAIASAVCKAHKQSNKRIMQMLYIEAKAKCAEIENRVNAASLALKAFPKGIMGLTSDSIKAQPDYKAAKAEFDAAFFAQQQINRFINKHYHAERLADHRAKRNIFGND